MLRQLSIIIILVMLLSCKKEVAQSGFDNYFNKLLICDSIRTQNNSNPNVTVVGKGKGFDLLFTPAGNTGQYGTVGSYKQYTSPVQEISFRYERPDKLYYWSPDSNIHEGDYFTILSVTGKNVILHHLKIGTDEETFFYYTAE